MSLIALATASLYLLSSSVNAQVTATGTMGVTNPPQATMGTAINQTSYARLLSLNSINDWCVFGPPEPNSVIGNTEAYEVAWCIQPRNNARVIPDGTVTAAHMVKTPLYWQIQGFGDFTKINIASGDQGGELDPHGATGDGNPVGGNVTCNATGSDVHYEEWMNYMSYNQFCLRICIAENSTYPAALECQHTLDEMGCEWVMPGDYSTSGFTECDADSAYPPGIYPQGNGQTSTFAQRYTGTYTQGGTVGTFTVGQTVTPQTPYSTPASSNCKTYTSIGNGISSLANAAAVSTGSASTTASGSKASSSSSSGSKTSGSSNSATGSMASGANANSSSSTSKAGAMTTYNGANYGSAFAVVFTVFAIFTGVGAVLM